MSRRPTVAAMVKLVLSALAAALGSGCATKFEPEFAPTGLGAQVLVLPAVNPTTIVAESDATIFTSVGGGVVLNPDSLLLTAHQLRDRDEVFTATGTVIVNGFVTTYAIQSFDRASEDCSVVAKLSPPLPDNYPPSIFEDGRHLPPEAGEPLYFVCPDPCLVPHGVEFMEMVQSVFSRPLKLHPARVINVAGYPESTENLFFIDVAPSMGLLPGASGMPVVSMRNGRYILRGIIAESVEKEEKRGGWKKLTRVHVVFR